MSEKVLLILVDGMRPDGLKGCGDDWLARYYENGTYSYEGKTVYPSITLPCHMTLFHSVEPERHGTLDNDFVYRKDQVQGLFELASDHGKSTAMFYIWEQLRDIVKPGYLDYSWYMAWEKHTWEPLDRRTTDACEAYLDEFEPDFAFLYLGETDEWGHTYGWMSPEYLETIRRASECIRRMAEKYGDRYNIIVTADHGGHDYEHGSLMPEDMTIPIVFHGPSFPAGKVLEQVSIKDIAPTIAQLLGLTPDPEWEGHSVIV